MEKILKALANRRRLAIIAYLKDRGEAPVNDISRKIGLSFRSTSKHLSVLRGADIVEREQRNIQIFYCLAKEQKAAAISIIKLL